MVSIGVEYIGYEIFEYLSMVDKDKVICIVLGVGMMIIKGMVVNVIYFKGLDLVFFSFEKDFLDSFSSLSSFSSMSSFFKEEFFSIVSLLDSILESLK